LKKREEMERTFQSAIATVRRELEQAADVTRQTVRWNCISASCKRQDRRQDPACALA
jgi:hypothetical protein